MADESEWASEASEQALVPAEQATIRFYDREIIAVRLPDGRIAAALRSMCDALQLERYSQVRRIRDDDVLADQLVPVQVETAGGLQPMEMLTAWAIPTWLTGIKLGKVAPAKRDAIRAFKREAADALYQHFANRPTSAQLAAPARLVPSEPIARPVAPGEGASPAAWLEFHRQMVAFLEWQGDVERWRGEVEARLETVEEVTRLVPEILERLGPQTLKPEHQRTMQNLAKRLHEVSGAAFATIYAELGEHFHVAKYDQVPESQWQEVTTWFKVRLDAAARRQSR